MEHGKHKGVRIGLIIQEMPAYMNWIMSEIGGESHPQFRRLKMAYMISRKGLLTNDFAEEPQGTSSSSKDLPASGKVPAKYQIHIPKSTDAEVEEEDGAPTGLARCVLRARGGPPPARPAACMHACRPARLHGARGELFAAPETTL